MGGGIEVQGEGVGGRGGSGDAGSSLDGEDAADQVPGGVVAAGFGGIHGVRAGAALANAEFCHGSDFIGNRPLEGVFILRVRGSNFKVAEDFSAVFGKG